MNKQELVAQGVRLIGDANFVYKTFPQAAMQENRWNIVMFEAYRASELLIKGIICNSGNELKIKVKKRNGLFSQILSFLHLLQTSEYRYRYSHNLKKHISQLLDILEKYKEKFPFAYAAITPTGDCYFLRFIENEMELLKKISGRYTILDSGTLLDQTNTFVPIKFIIDGPTVTIRQGDYDVLSLTDSDITGEVTYEGQILIPPAEDQIIKLKKVCNQLYKTRTEAFYNEKEFTEEEANEALLRLHSVFEISKEFKFTDLTKEINN